MSETDKALIDGAFVKTLAQAITSSRRRSLAWLADQVLRVGETGLPRVYSDPAIALLEEAFAEDEDDCTTIHRLAIAHHARAWDMELAHDAEAAVAWTKALYFWMRLHACRAYWRQLAEKGGCLGLTFDATRLDAFRRQLPEHLLQVHADFVAHYLSCGELDHAQRHVAIVDAARVAPATRRCFPDVVLHTLQPDIDIALGSGRYESVMERLAMHLQLFPGHASANLRYLDAAREMLMTLSPLDQWQDIQGLSERCMQAGAGLASDEATLGSLATEPLASLARLFGEKCFARARQLSSELDASIRPQQPVDESLRAALGMGIDWLARAHRLNPGDSDIKARLAACLMERSGRLTWVAQHTDAEVAALALFEQAIEDCERAMELAADKVQPSLLLVQLLKARAAWHLWTDSDREWNLRRSAAERDLSRAMALAPEDEQLQALMGQIELT